MDHGHELFDDGVTDAALPSRLKLLCISADEPSWTMLALSLSRHGCVEPQFRWCFGAAQALAALRDETFDCAILFAETASNERNEVVTLLSAMYAAGSVDPLVVLLTQGDDSLLGRLGTVECEILMSPGGWQSPALPIWIDRARQRIRRLRENARLTSAEQRRTSRERSEANSALDQQRRFLADDAWRSTFAGISQTDADFDSATRELPPQVASYYEQLLRSTVMMGTGSLSGEVRQLAQLLAGAGLTPRAALRLHIERVEDLIRGLGARSSRHVMNRADLLAMELMVQLADCYRDKSRLTGLGDYGIDLLHERIARQPASPRSASGRSEAVKKS